MSVSRCIVLKLPLSTEADLAAFVDNCFASTVELIALCGEGGSDVEDELDDLIIAHDLSRSHMIVTATHATENGAIELAVDWAKRNSCGKAEVVTL
ncbi:hypothetical protein MED193_17194 [Roseobacter sp. MED193]|uniref:hypothetical protein n=1 Tax=Roseobacter sp. MED193 TaxID=314262 RepID=UPI000068B818|nr:hypothetical protein [Roseobacter sp. MED193]EAQ46950.1 hypothetical protein MED193_17194 [Roseobacter sp. MED193]